MPRYEIPIGPLQLNIHYETMNERIAELEEANVTISQEYCLGPIEDRCKKCSTLYNIAVNARDRLQQQPLQRNISLQLKK